MSNKIINKNIYLICNAHIDPIWLWTWQEGAAAAISTFRTAADFCEDFDGFVFNHNEAILYEWIEEYEPELFERIKRLVKMGKWKIIGGWYLQPDCVMPSGESFVRQIKYGREYFAEKFGVEPKTAVSFDSFGHSRGLVQILKKTGYDSYLFMRPGTDKGDFIWKGFDQSEIKAHCHYGGYNTLKGQATIKIEEVMKYCQNENLLVLWGVGDHGGGPSREDLKMLEQYIKEHNELNIKHSYPEEYFETVKCTEKTFDKSLGPCMVGCYSTMARIKQGNRRIENKLEMMKRMAAQAGIELKDDVKAAEKAFMLCQFHDCLPGTMIKKGENQTLNSFGFTEKICDEYIAKAFFKMCRGQKKCKDGEIPIMVYNPLPYSVCKEIEVEYQLENQNWNKDEYTVARVRDEQGNYLPTQNEKEDCTFSLDWRKKIAFRAELKPMQINRFDCELEVKKNYSMPKFDCGDNDCLVFENPRMTLKINKKTGLIDEYTVDGVKRLCKGSAAINVYADNEDPWGMTVSGFDKKIGRFEILNDADSSAFRGYAEEIIPNINIVENGDVRTKAEIIFKSESSTAVIKYTVPKNDIYFDIDIALLSNDKNKAYKLSFNTAASGEVYGQTAFGTEALRTDGSEITFNEWVGRADEDCGVYIINSGSYGGSAQQNNIDITLLRTPVYSAHPIEDRQIAPKTRVNEHIDLGEREFHFRVTADSFVDYEAEIFNMPVYALSFFPSGDGKAQYDAYEIDNKNILLSTLQSKHGDTLIRLYNSKNESQSCGISFEGAKENVQFSAFEVKTFIKNGERLKEVDMLGRAI